MKKLLSLSVISLFVASMLAFSGVGALGQKTEAAASFAVYACKSTGSGGRFNVTAYYYNYKSTSYSVYLIAYGVTAIGKTSPGNSVRTITLNGINPTTSIQTRVGLSTLGHGQARFLAWC